MAFSTSGRARVLSSVTIITGTSWRRQKATALRAVSTRKARSQPSTSMRMGLEPRNAPASRGNPTRCWISATWTRSASMVRTATLGWRGRRWSRISTMSARTAARALGPAPGMPRSTASTPRLARRWMRSRLSAMSGSRTEGLWSPSRRVSSSSAGMRPSASGPFQSLISSSRVMEESDYGDFDAAVQQGAQKGGLVAKGSHFGIHIPQGLQPHAQRLIVDLHRHFPHRLAAMAVKRIRPPQEGSQLAHHLAVPGRQGAEGLMFGVMRGFAAMEAHHLGQHLYLLGPEAGQGGVAHQVLAVLVMVLLGEGKTDVM